MKAKQPKAKGPERRAVRRSDDADAFFPDPENGPAQAPDALAEQIAEEYLQAATTGEDQSEEQMEATVSEEIGGPFIETAATDELALTIDSTNPADAPPEPLPRAVAGLATTPALDEELDAAAANDDEAMDEAEDREDDRKATSELPPLPHTD